MAAYGDLTAHVLIAIGEGPATEVATVQVPLRAVLRREDGPGPWAGLYIDVDMHSLYRDIKAALHEVADGVAEPPPITDEDRERFIQDWRDRK